MIVLTVISYNGAPVNLPPVSFDELGGTIGRADTNQMVLPDSERTISRVHAQIAFRGGHYALVDRGSNAVLHNGQPIGNGREVLLVADDEIQIGGYRISVSTGAPAKSNDPFAGFDAEASAFKSSSAPTPSRPRTDASLSARPRADMEAPAPARATPPRPAPLPPPPPAPAPAAGRAASGIPEDWDPFRPDPTTAVGVGGRGAPAPSRPPSGNPLMDDLPVAQPSSEQSLDALFGLSGGAPGVADPLAGSALLGPAVQPNTAGGADPLQALLNPAQPGAAPVSDHASDLQSPWRDTPARTRPPAPPAFTAPAPAPQAGPATPTGAVLSWDQPAKAPPPAGAPAPQMLIPESATIIGRPSGRAAVAPVVPPAAPAVAVRAESGLAPSPASAAAADTQQLLQAFLKGLGAPELRMGPISADSMFQLGQLVRESAQGTIDLLAARTALKKEVRAEVTVMVANANNALKFSPTVEFALQYLLGPPTTGFMGPVDSMRDAYDSLRAHQLGVMAGMRGALTEVVKRFDPAVLEEKLAARARGGLLPSSRKAKLWELFQELFGQLAHEAEEDFDEIFGKAFVREYERIVAQLSNPSNKP
jgi:type VI secretion system FHA domain protein